MMDVKIGDVVMVRLGHRVGQIGVTVKVPGHPKIGFSVAVQFKDGVKLLYDRAELRPPTAQELMLEDGP